MSDVAARPWQIRGTVKRGDLSIRSAVPNDDLYNIATLSSKGTAGFLPETVEANAALIVKAVNAHDSLVEACELASEHEECVCDDKPKGHGPEGECLGCVLTAALRKAKS